MCGGGGGLNSGLSAVRELNGVLSAVRELN